MNDLRQLFGSYNICARFAPGFLFVLAIYFLLGYDIKNLESNSVILIVLLCIMSSVCGFASAAIMKIIEQKLWNIYSNPIILYLKKKNKRDIYEDLLSRHNNDNNIIIHILKVTRNDNRLFWKNVSYGFFRNSILLSLVCLYFSYPTEYCYYNIGVCVATLIMTFICSFYYAREAVKGLREITYHRKNKYFENKIRRLHKKIFPKYKGIYQGKEVVLIATGPTLSQFNPLDNAIYVGVNKAFKYSKVKFDYIFLQDFSGATKNYIEDFCNYDAKKFIGFIFGIYEEWATKSLIPKKYAYYDGVEPFFVAHPEVKETFTCDISTQPFGDAYSIVFPAMQFILWTNPKKIYLVGCDCNVGGYYDSLDKNTLMVNEVICGWKKMKEFCKTFYPDVEVVSINPVGLKGIFKDEYQKKDSKNENSAKNF